MSKWFDSLPEHTKEYLKAQPIWHDSDMWRAGIFGLVIGFILGVIL
jgi:hypothetical protein